jgi:hypothetical protein
MKFALMGGGGRTVIFYWPALRTATYDDNNVTPSAKRHKTSGDNRQRAEKIQQTCGISFARLHDIMYYREKFKLKLTGVSRLCTFG